MKPPKKIDRRKKSKRGGQKGHPRKLREPLAPERVDESMTYEINDDAVRKLKLIPTDLWISHAGHDRLAQITGALQLLDHRDLVG